MASEAPDPRTFKGWEDAFQYPIPVVRKLEQQLRSNAGENRERLRSLVGASYRDLLSTAETIIDMEDRMSSVESKVARISQNCNSSNVERISRNAGTIHTHNKSRDIGRYTFAAQLAVLRSCPVVMVRLMEKEVGSLLHAKVLVISRLLHKALSQSSIKAEIVDNLRDRLGSLRRKLLRRIDKGLASENANAALLVESMCAYSLATASTPTDVLRHFLHIRMEVINKSLRHDSGLKEHGLSALKLCLQTCADVQTIFPRRLADALLKLKSQPLVQDPDVRALYELSLDIHDRWIGDETRYYVPQPRHDELSRPEAERLLHQWSRQAIPTFLKGIKEALEKTNDLKAVAELRQELIETWIVSGSRMAGVKSNNVLDDLRDTMNGQLERIMQERTQALKHVVEDITKQLAHPASDKQPPNLSLWVKTSHSIDLSNGAQDFKTSILNTHYGRDESILRIVDSYDNWMQSILEVKSIVKTMKEMRWDDPFEDDVDIEDSDDEFGDSKQTLLSDDDPRLLEDSTRDALGAALHTLGERLSKIAVEETKGEGSQAVAKTTFLLRIIREISDRIPQLRLNDRSESLQNPFNNELLRPLHRALATQIVRPTVSSYDKKLAAAGKFRTKSQILWEGNPPLPAQPSPTAFRFLQELNRSMSEFGSDLWAPHGVQVLKSIAGEELLKAWGVAVKEAMQIDKEVPKPEQEDTDTKAEDQESSEDPKVEAAQAQKPDAEDLRQRRLKQLFFDILYIERFLSSSNASDHAASVKDQVYKASGLDESGKARLHEKAADYGRKTYLLFALLA